MKTRTIILSSLMLFFSLSIFAQSAERYDGKVVFSVPMQGFEFEKSLMQKHFNQDKFLDTKQFPTGRLVGNITNIETIDFTTPGTYDAVIEGEMTIRGVTNKIKENGKLTVTDQGLNAHSVFDITLADYGIEFVKGKPSKNIAKTVEVTIEATYTGQ